MSLVLGSVGRTLRSGYMRLNDSRGGFSACPRTVRLGSTPMVGALGTDLARSRLFCRPFLDRENAHEFYFCVQVLDVFHQAWAVTWRRFFGMGLQWG